MQVDAQHSLTRSTAPRPVRFALATPADDADLRRLLRDNPMAGQISVSLEREPGYFVAAAIEGRDHQTIIASEAGQILCAGSVSVRPRYLNGQPTRVGYLGGLRLDASARGRASVIRRGYEMFRQLHEEQGGPTVYLTAIAEDNAPARRLLERGLSGMPTYRPIARLITLVIRRRDNGHRMCKAPQRAGTRPHAGAGASSDGPDAAPPMRVPSRAGHTARARFGAEGLDLVYGNDALVPEIVRLLNRGLAGYQFAPVWSDADFLDPTRTPGLCPSAVRLIRAADRTPVACAAFWDQRAFKQIVVRRYTPALRRVRWLYNAWAAFSGRPRLPSVGRPLAHAFVSHVVTAPDRPDHVEWLVRLLHGPAHTRGVDYLTLALDDRDPRLPYLRRAFRPREYVSRLYAVHWPDGAAAAEAIDTTRLAAPEVATL